MTPLCLPAEEQRKNAPPPQQKMLCWVVRILPAPAASIWQEKLRWHKGGPSSPSWLWDCTNSPSLWASLSCKYSAFHSALMVLRPPVKGVAQVSSDKSRRKGSPQTKAKCFSQQFNNYEIQLAVVYLHPIFFCSWQELNSHFWLSKVSLKPLSYNILLKRDKAVVHLCSAY